MFLCRVYARVCSVCRVGSNVECVEYVECVSHVEYVETPRVL